MSRARVFRTLLVADLPFLFFLRFWLKFPHSLAMTCVIPLEAIGTEMVEAYDERTNLFFHIGWWDFLQPFQGYNQGVVEAFVSSFDGEKAQV